MLTQFFQSIFTVRSSQIQKSCNYNTIILVSCNDLFSFKKLMLLGYSLHLYSVCNVLYVYNMLFASRSLLRKTYFTTTQEERLFTTSILLISVNMQAVPLICIPDYKSRTVTNRHHNISKKATTIKICARILNYSLFFALLSKFPLLGLLRFFHIILNNNWLNLVKYASISTQRNSFSLDLEKIAHSLFLNMHLFCCSKFATTVF